MKNFILKSSLLIAFLLFLLGQNSFGQLVYKITDSKDNSMKISGTSTFHNREMNSSVFSGDAKFGFKSGSKTQLASINSLSFSILVKNLKSGENGLDDNAYKALNTDSYTTINYTLVSSEISPSGINRYLVKTIGNLTIAGISKSIAMNVYCVVNGDGSITAKGNYQLKMTDFKVEPPSFMLGVMKTGDEITLDFIAIYKK